MDQKAVKQSNGRMFLIYGILVVFAMYCIVRILTLAISYRSLFMGESEKCLDKTVPGWDTLALAKNPNCNCFVVMNEKIPRRGDIYDSKGRVLASSIMIYDLTIDGRDFKITNRRYCDTYNRNIKKDPDYKASFLTESQIDSSIQVLAQAMHDHFKSRFNKNAAYYQAKLTQALRDSAIVLIHHSNPNNDRSWIVDEDIDFITSFTIFDKDHFKRSLSLNPRRARLNPYGDLAKRTVGYEHDKKWNGLEFEMDTFLRGVPGAKKKVVVSLIDIPMEDETMPQNGYDVHTTLDLDIQNIVQNELYYTLRNHWAGWGCAVVMDVKTGEVKAISNLTSMDSSHTFYKEVTNFAVNKQVEPGSTFKLASLLAYLDRTTDDEAKKYPILAHTFQVKRPSGRMVKYSKADEPGKSEAWAYPIEAFQRSSNVGIASMIFDRYKGYSDYLDKLDSMGISTTFYTHLGTSPAPDLKRWVREDDFHSYYNICFGTGISTTPIQTLTYFNAVANDGKMIAPLFVKCIINGKDTIAKFEAEVLKERMCKFSTIARAQNYLRSVVNGEHGTARRYRNAKYSFAGKTGTRDVWDRETKGYLKNRNSVSFCGYFPAENPQYSCIIFIYDVHKKSSIAVDAFAHIVQQVMSLTDLGKVQTVSTGNGVSLPAGNRSVSGEQLEIIQGKMKLNQGIVSDPEYYYNLGITEGGAWGETAKEVEYDENNIPNVLMMSASDAIYRLQKEGYKTIIIGKGVVRRQSAPDKNNTVTLTLGL
ncbi:MAG: hypothetical protein LBV02_08205 [Bacteroidales bacterium]|jgi:cell division protein FtsI (penicillin-binding protein 3)|nr:hypothetical protein [Bacteroidales bacterium]